ncbi:hypothetical protein [Janthinobacterium sp. 17J80-10]|uniref:hypothetical protein n=1 Tax=Janthinobacterium sp. 17J80-10 TaxID=2497863 RepID=UPI0010055E64|nr:hypothetical protein [Janthinobacterium sp. 17J80-10]QAU33099.1 hypothetical protein EKL02_02305 [Janthinobacterium sp. 17J80-10]
MKIYKKHTHATAITLALATLLTAASAQAGDGLVQGLDPMSQAVGQNSVQARAGALTAAVNVNRASSGQQSNVESFAGPVQPLDPLSQTWYLHGSQTGSPASSHGSHGAN